MSANGVRVVIKLAPLLHCLAVFLMEATTVRYFLSLAPCEMPKEKGKIWKKPQSWKELSWENRIRLLYLRLVHCLTTVLVPWVQRDWDFESRKDITDAEKNFYLERWKQVRREYLAQTCLFCLENLLMLGPLLNTCLTVIHVYSTIPILPEWRGV